MDKYQDDDHSLLQNGSDEDFELMGDMPREDPIIIERRRQRNNEITKKLGSYLLKGYCMLSDACTSCDCILLRTPERQLLCVGCAEVDVENAKDDEKTTGKQNIDLTNGNEQRLASAQSIDKKKERIKRSKKRNKHTSSTCEGDSVSNGNTNYSIQLENKLKWAVDELTKSHNPNRINAMCTVIINLTESIKALKDYELASA